MAPMALSRAPGSVKGPKPSSTCWATQAPERQSAWFSVMTLGGSPTPWPVLSRIPAWNCMT